MAVPDPARTSSPEQPKPTISSVNKFFMYLGMILGYLLFHRMAWASVVYMLGGFPGMDTLINILKWLWFIPILGILGSIISPSVGTTLLWVIVSACVSAVPLTIVSFMVLWSGFDRERLGANVARIAAAAAAKKTD
jgi:hypothetical protein